MALSKKHFEAIADIISSHNNINTDQKRSITNSFIKYFKTQNKNFDPFKFYNKSMVNNYNGLTEIKNGVLGDDWKHRKGGK